MQLQNQYCNHANVTLCSSMPSIEFWFLLHYLNTNRFFYTSDEVIKVLKKYIPQFDKDERFLKQSKWVEGLVTNEKMPHAIERAQKLPREKGASYTDVWKLVEG